MAADGGIWMTVGAAAVFAVYYVVIIRQFQGLSGDLAGWFVQTAEVWMLAILCLTQMMERG
jgi:adenosylcobinamide-GDP ribazoletransferase